MLNLLNKIEYLKICFKHALQFPFVEVVEDGVKGREVPREHTPLAPRFDYVHDSIHNVPKRVFSFAMLRIQDNSGICADLPENLVN